MAGSFSTVAGGRSLPGAGPVLRVGRRTLKESLYLLTGPVSAVAGLLIAFGGLCVAMLGRAVGRAPAAAPMYWSADLEWWRIDRVRAARPGPERPGPLPGPSGGAPAPDPKMWLSLAHAVVLPPVALVTAVITTLWWIIGLGAATTAVRNWGTAAGTPPPMTLSTGSGPYHVDLSLGLTSPTTRMVFGTVVGLLLVLTLPLLTRTCVAVQAGLGRALLSDASPRRRRIRGLEQERDTARAQTAAALTAEALALRRLERDIHDGPQQRLVRLAMELGRAQRHLERRPETVREALADAMVQAEEALEELRALSRGIAPPILVDRGLRAALAELALRSTVPALLDAGTLSHRPEAAVETTAYFVVSEALTNVAKHSQAGRCVIGLRHEAELLRIWVTDDGAGGAAFDKGHGLRGLRDRVRAVGGQLSLASPLGGPTTITAELPCR
ncbi:sensor domain-containing protein [Frankia sp. AgB1.9]|uniref:sensor histidine kinase n=1 Tax=unclassified Frankia TaxID=2632575 RepID=UPI001932731D|nr:MULTISPECIES: histidine kinase [unclassified Frankia]MBL7490698.1 sensor domain-containing protein [Frankia sp. AgW1.1]MBL7547708.1 sensor domain-containing protein [Frankia sp. AgB1.9]MBL7622650.1 sensor domain-containing protein [Frankia sp. AgB1.8]